MKVIDQDCFIGSHETQPMMAQIPDYTYDLK